MEILLEPPPDEPRPDTGKWLPEMWEEFLEGWMTEIREDLGLTRRIKRRFKWSKEMKTIMDDMILDDTLRLEHLLAQLRKLRERQPSSEKAVS